MVSLLLLLLPVRVVRNGVRSCSLLTKGKQQSEGDGEKYPVQHAEHYRENAGSRKPALPIARKFLAALRGSADMS